MAGLFVLSTASSILKNLEKHAWSPHQRWLTFRFIYLMAPQKKMIHLPIFFPLKTCGFVDLKLLQARKPF